MALVVGNGEVGSAVAAVLGCEAVDITSVGEPVDHLHICFPYSVDFLAEVDRYRDLFTPDLLVIHSTVPVGTSAKLDAIHSPVRGRHPDLEEALRVFVKFFAGPRAEDAATYWPGPTRIVGQQATTEAGKLWELLHYGLVIAAQKEMAAWCTQVGADPDIAYREFAETYNAGYATLGDHQFKRPVIEPTDGPIGGHCIIANAAHIDHPLARLLEELNDQWRLPCQ